MLKQNFPDWTGKTAVILAGGYSLSDEQIEAVRHKQVEAIAVNSTFKRVPWARVVYAGDFMWVKTYAAEMRKTCKHAAFWTCDRSAAERWDLNWVKGVNALGLCREKKMIHTNGNSGAQAINLAYLFGSRRILLLGFDMKLGPKGEKHHHPDHPHPLVQQQTFEEWCRKLGIMAPELEAAGCEVINCTTDTALTCFKRSTIEQGLG